MPDFYVDHDGEQLNFNKSDWNVNYLNKQMVIVVNNFSRERINLLKEMVKVVLKDKYEKMMGRGGQICRIIIPNLILK